MHTMNIDSHVTSRKKILGMLSKWDKEIFINRLSILTNRHAISYSSYYIRHVHLIISEISVPWVLQTTQYLCGSQPQTIWSQWQRRTQSTLCEPGANLPVYVTCDTSGDVSCRFPLDICLYCTTKKCCTSRMANHADRKTLRVT